ncbi:CBS domain-containing protein [Desulforhopalus sp. IMCC35007]|nr:CBS domain-containing protein [Desulforhopalus sp. IMCC35007]
MTGGNMHQHLAKDLMVPISEYATVEIGTPLIEAIQALEVAQGMYTESKYQHRAVLVLDKSGNVVGKITQIRALKAIEPDFDFLHDIEDIKKFKFSEDYLVQLRTVYREKSKIINTETLTAAANKKVEEFMQDHSPGEYIDENGSIDQAIHKIVSGKHLSLLVTNGDRITGILRVADVFTAVFGELTALKL